jgi:hypothetical protein
MKASSKIMNRKKRNSNTNVSADLARLCQESILGLRDKYLVTNTKNVEKLLLPYMSLKMMSVNILRDNEIDTSTHK